MKKFLMILASTLLMATASAATIDDSKLSDEQKAQVQKMVADLEAKKPDNISATARAETEKWVELGGNMGKAAVGAAKELGMAANEFVATPLGRVTMGVVIYKVIGKDIIGMIVGGCIVVFFLTMAVVLLRMKKYTNATYEYKPVLFGLRQRQFVMSGSIDNEWAVGYMIASFVCIVIGLLVGLNIMF